MAESGNIRSLAARVGAYSLHAKYDSREITRAAREAFLKKWIDQVDPDRSLTEDERLRRAEAALKAHMAQLALKSAKVRSAKKAVVDE
jgi:hypothetical protein